MERASLDVQLGRRRRQMRTLESAASANSRKATQNPGGASATTDAKVIYPLPEHMDNELSYMCLKCTFCSVPLPVDPMDKKHVSSTWMRKQRPVMSCCPNCKRQMPRCYVCLFFTGVLNPQMELKVVAKRREIEHATATALNLVATASNIGDLGAQVNEKVSALDGISSNIFKMSKWFMWCQKCKHGGHAGCLDDWFTTRQTCGVNGCPCICRNSVL